MTTEFRLSRRLAVEALGTGFLVATIVGSGIMATSLTEDAGLALLCNSIATGAMLVVLIAAPGPISGAHFNPLVSLALAASGDMRRRDAMLYGLAQIAGGVFGTIVAQTMFGRPAVEVAATVRTGEALWMSEAVATFGLLGLILLAGPLRIAGLPLLVGSYIVAAYWFTASTSFANPAVTVARSLTDSFAGIRPLDLPGFLLAECFGALLAVLLVRWLLRPEVAAHRELLPQAA